MSKLAAAAYWNGPPVESLGDWRADPKVADLLDKAGQAADPTSVKDVYDQLDKIFMDNVVGIPLMYRPQEFYEYNQKYWTGFPTYKNAYVDPIFSTGNQVEKILLNLRPVRL